jgi:hypothetical protein
VGDTKEVKVNPGDQLVDCVSTDAATVSINELKTATAGTQSAVLLQLADRVNQELQQAAAAAQAKADAEAKALADAQAERERIAAEAELAARFVGQTDGSVLDTKISVFWAGQDNGSDINWNDAKRHCAKLGTEWVLPTVSELQGLYDSSGTLRQSCRNLTCNVSPLIRLSSYWYWSDEANDTSQAWAVFLADGDRNSVAADYASDHRSLCVRRS